MKRCLSSAMLLIFVLWGALNAQAQQQRFYEAFEGGKSGLIDISGNWVLKPAFDSISELENQRIFFYRGGLQGIATMSGKVIVKPVYDHLTSDAYDLAIAVDSQGTSVIKAGSGRRISRYFRDASFYLDGLLCVQDSSGKWGAIDRYGARAIPCEYDTLEDFSNGVAWAWRDGRSCFIDDNGSPTDSPVYWSRWRSTEKDFRFESESGWGLRNAAGATVSQPIYDYISYPSGDGLLRFWKDARCGVIDTNGIIRVAAKYDDLRYFRLDAINVASLSGHWGLIDGKENIVVPFEYDAIDFLHDTLYAASMNGSWGILSRAGNWIVNPRFERIRGGLVDFVDNEETEYNEYRSYRKDDRMFLSSYHDDGSVITFLPERDDADDVTRARVFPNPSRGLITIQLSGESEVAYALHNNKGGIVRTGKLTAANTELDISSLPAGAYLLLVTGPGISAKLPITKL